VRQPTAPFSVTAGVGTSLHFAATVNLILHVTNIAIFYQDDSFGHDGLVGVRRAEPQAVVMIGTYGPCAEFIRLAHKAGFHPTFVSVSFVGANALARELGAAGAGVVVSQVVPFPWDTSLKVVADYQAAQTAPRFHPVAGASFPLEGYLSGPPRGRRSRTGRADPTRAGLLRPSTRSAGSISAEASSPSDRRCGMCHPRSSSPSFRRTDPSRPSTGCDAVMERRGLEPVASAC